MSSGIKRVDQTLVLVVEDEPRLRKVLTEGVRECGFQATGVRTGAEALAAMANVASDIAILDLDLPGMDGLHCFERLRERWPDMAAVILTGFGTLEAAQRAIRLGVVEFLTKPASLGELEQALQRAWRSLPVRTREDGPAGSADSNRSAAGTGTPVRSLRELEREWIVTALKRHGGNREATAAELGISVRKLYYRLSEYQQDGGDPNGEGI